MRTSLLIALLSLAGCGGAGTVLHPLDDAGRALRLHASLRHHVYSVSAVARVEQRGDAGRIRGTVYALLATPARLRFDVMTQLGAVATLTSDGGRFALLDQREGRFFEGPSCTANVARFLGVGLPPEQVLTLLVGGVPESAPDAVRTIEPVPGGYRVRVEDAAVTTVATFAVAREDLAAEPERQRLRLRRLELRDPGGRPRMVLTYDDYRVVPDPLDDSDPQHGVAMPYVVRIVDLHRGAELTVRFRELSLNGELVEDVFTQEAPSGMVVERAACP